MVPAMVYRPSADSVAKVAGPPVDVERLERELDELRQHHPGAIIGRYLDKVPRIAASAYVAPGAAVVGDVVLAEESSIWYGCVLRGDINRIEVRERSNLQDGTVVHLDDEIGTFVGEEVVVGHRAVLHGCCIGGGCLIGIQATVLDGANVGEGSIVGAGALVLADTVVPRHSLVLGVPGKVVRSLSAADEDFHRQLARKYARVVHNYRMG
jgi:carbonic anhydrase/acetyltransferase-like protein (isoleucine patch superfamily)